MSQVRVVPVVPSWCHRNPCECRGSEHRQPTDDAENGIVRPGESPDLRRRPASLSLTSWPRGPRQAVSCENAARDSTPVEVDEDATVVLTGFDDPRLDTLLLTMPIAWKGTVVQYAGRLHRAHPAKRDIRIYDYVDAEVPVLRRMYAKRLRTYREMGYICREGQELSLSV